MGERQVHLGGGVVFCCWAIAADAWRGRRRGAGQESSVERANSLNSLNSTQHTTTHNNTQSTAEITGKHKKEASEAKR